MTAEELMTPDPETLTADDTVRDAMDLLYSLGVRHIPIVRRGRLVGMVSDRDLRDVALPTLAAFEHPEESRKAWARKLGDVMHGDVISVGPEEDAAEIIDLMIDHKVGAIPVVDPDSEELVGIVSYIDVLRVCRDLI